VSLQIAAPDCPDEPERMVIITGPPEAQFKVKAIMTNVVYAPVFQDTDFTRVSYINLYSSLISPLLFYVCVGTGEDIWEVERGEFFHS